MAGGRPRSVVPCKEEMIALGEEMIEWVKRNKPVHINQWWLIEKDIMKNVWNSMRQTPEFLHYYEKALSIIGNLYIDKESNVDPRVKDRFLRLYHKDLRDQEDADLRFQESIKSEFKNDDEAMSAINKVMDYVSRAQAPSKDLTNSSTDKTS